GGHPTPPNRSTRTRMRHRPLAEPPAADDLHAKGLGGRRLGRPRERRGRSLLLTAAAGYEAVFRASSSSRYSSAPVAPHFPAFSFIPCSIASAAVMPWVSA